MKKLTTLSELRTQLDPEVVCNADAAFAEEYVSYALAQLRRQRDLSQVEIAQALNKIQVTINKLENSTGKDVLQSNFDDYVNAVGAREKSCAPHRFLINGKDETTIDK